MELNEAFFVLQRLKTHCCDSQWKLNIRETFFACGDTKDWKFWIGLVLWKGNNLECENYGKNPFDDFKQN